MAIVGPTSRGTAARNGRSDIFPSLGQWVFLGAACGILIAVVFATLRPTNGWNPIVYAMLGGAVGGIGGLFAGWGQAVWRVGEPVNEQLAPRRPVSLWDPWLDAGRDLVATPEPQIVVQDAEAGETDKLELAGSVLPARAAVRPRVISPETGDGILLEDELGLLLQAGNRPFMAIVGPPGSGKTTALRHIAAVLPPWALSRVRLMDHPQPIEAAAMAAFALANPDTTAVVAGHRSLFPSASTYHVAAWGQDDLIEYLQSVHRDRCASVMRRLRASGELGFLEGIPELWTAVLDRMAEDESIPDVRTALEQALRERLSGDTVVWKRIEDFCLDSLGTTAHAPRTTAAFQILAEVTFGNAVGAELLHLLRHRPAGLLLAADRLATIVGHGPPPAALEARFPHDLVQETARRLGEDGNALEALRVWLTTAEHASVHPMAASLLHAAGSKWCPDRQDELRLTGAYLEKICWPRVALQRVDLSEADLSDADLTAARLDNAIAKGTQFRRATLERASLGGLRAQAADLSEANLRSAKAPEARFKAADFSGASLIEANCWKANFQGADITDADFSGAILEDARLVGLDLGLARFDGARFGGADLRRCNLENMELADADFHDTDCRAALFTDSRMARANFVGADLRESGLAGIDWPRACLRDADLRGASFHLGSSRDGLIDSPIACEGSRTGFYTDDYHDRDIKPAEEIRKANLRGADLRGAVVDDVDFYLVDLRDARYTPDQKAHFQNCRAILEGRA